MSAHRVPQKKQTPLEVANFIGEDNAAKLIEALLAGQSGDGIGADEADELGDEIGAVDIADDAAETPAPTDRSEAASEPPAAKPASEAPPVVAAAAVGA